MNFKFQSRLIYLPNNFVHLNKFSKIHQIIIKNRDSPCKMLQLYYALNFLRPSVTTRFRTCEKLMDFGEVLIIFA